MLTTIGYKATPKALGSIADVAIAGTTTVQILAANANRRKAFIESLAANTVILRIGDSNTGAARGVELAIAATIEIETTGAIYGYNPNSTVMNVSITWTEN